MENCADERRRCVSKPSLWVFKSYKKELRTKKEKSEGYERVSIEIEGWEGSGVKVIETTITFK